jgi:hypothetical protein
MALTKNNGGWIIENDTSKPERPKGIIEKVKAYFRKEQPKGAARVLQMRRIKKEDEKRSG